MNIIPLYFRRIKWLVKKEYVLSANALINIVHYVRKTQKNQLGYEDGHMTDAEAKEKLEKLDLSRKEYFGESYKNSIASIMKAKAQVIKKENKKTEVKSVKKDIVTKVEKEAESNVE